MDVDKNNFKEVKKECLSKLQNVDLIAIDLEMTGIKTD